MTNYELVEFAKSKIGTSYVYGMKGAILTLEKYKEKVYQDLELIDLEEIKMRE